MSQIKIITKQVSYLHPCHYQEKYFQESQAEFGHPK